MNLALPWQIRQCLVVRHAFSVRKFFWETLFYAVCVHIRVGRKFTFTSMLFKLQRKQNLTQKLICWLLLFKVVNDLVFSGSSDQSVHAHNIHVSCAAAVEGRFRWDSKAWRLPLPPCLLPLSSKAPYACMCSWVISNLDILTHQKELIREKPRVYGRFHLNACFELGALSV